jgi:hypothetical protein
VNVSVTHHNSQALIEGEVALLARWLAAPPCLGYNIHQIRLLSSLTED